MSEALPLPPATETAKRAMEMARVWIVDGKQHVVLSPHLWSDPEAWGLMLVDLASHVANAYQLQGHDRQEVLGRIKQAFDVEWRWPTDGNPT